MTVPTADPDARPAVITPDLEAVVLRLNNAHATELSWLEPERLAALLRLSFHARAIGAVDAFLIALEQGAAYDNPNYKWFQERFEQFVYVDRIVVAPSTRGRGLAKRLYADLIDTAEAAGHGILACEVNIAPPNPASDAFHAMLGFVEVGVAAIHGGAKTVRYLARPLRGADGPGRPPLAGPLDRP